MTKESRRNIKRWFSNNIMSVIIAALLSLIGYGGRDILQGVQERQDTFDEELKTYREVQMGILKTIGEDRTASGFWFSCIDDNTERNEEQDKIITNHEIRISALEDD